MLGEFTTLIIKTKKFNYADNLSTPKDIFKLCENRWKVKCTLDVCATNLNHKCRRFITKNTDFMKVRYIKSNEILWFNFPHSKNYKFIKHLCELYLKSNFRAIGILPINVLTSNYAQKYIIPYIVPNLKKMIIQGRISFLNKAQKKSKHNSVNGYVTVYYPRRNKK